MTTYSSDAGSGSVLHGVGVISDDEGLIECLGGAMARSRARLVVASTPTAAAELLGDGPPDLCIVDGASSILPDDGFERSPYEVVLVVKHRAQDGLESHRVDYAYDRHTLEELVRHLASWIPGLADISDSVDGILGDGAEMALVRSQLRSVSRFRDVPVLILGETGTGKELVARALHDATFGRTAPFVAINCAAIPESLLESELFGHEAGAYTGARGVKAGLFEAASGGTIFLDEIGEMDRAMQPKLLRALESREFRRVGSNQVLTLRARVVSATNRNPWQPGSDALRADLTYRLAGFTIRLPPLRDRSGDIEVLTEAFIRAFRERHGTGPLTTTPEARELLRAHDWPGNIRELRAVVEHASIVSRDGKIGASDVRAALSSLRSRSGTGATVTPAAEGTGIPEPVEVVDSGRLRDVERALIARALAANNGNVSRTARQLGIPRSTLRSKLEKLEKPDDDDTG